MKATLWLSGLLVLVFGWHLVADRITPYTSNAQVKSMVIDVVPTVSGFVAALAVNNTQIGYTSNLLARIDSPTSRVETSQARLTQSAIALRVQSNQVIELETQGGVAVTFGAHPPPGPFPQNLVDPRLARLTAMAGWPDTQAPQRRMSYNR